MLGTGGASVSTQTWSLLSLTVGGGLDADQCYGEKVSREGAMECKTCSGRLRFLFGECLPEEGTFKQRLEEGEDMGHVGDGPGDGSPAREESGELRSEKLQGT